MTKRQMFVLVCILLFFPLGIRWLYKEPVQQASEYGPVREQIKMESLIQ